MITQNLGAYLETLHNHSRTHKPGFPDLPEDSTGRLLRKQEPPRAVVRGVYSLVLYPNGEFGLGRLNREQKTAADRRFDRGQVADCTVQQQAHRHEAITGEVYHDSTDLQAVPVKLGKSANLSQPRPRYGRKGITSYGRRMVRNAAWCLARAKSRASKLQMGTITIPSLPESQMKEICVNWAYLHKRFFERCKRRYAGLGFDWDYVAVTEVQPKRWELRREVGLHIHFLFVSYWDKQGNQWALPDSWVRNTWRRLLSNLLGGDTDLPTPNYRRESIRKSAAGYMAKYLSKGGNQVEEVIAEMGEEWLPTRWWSASMALRKTVQTSCLRCRGDIAEMVLDVCERRPEGCLHYAHDICKDISAYTRIPYANKPLRIGWTGCLTDWFMEYIGMPREDLYYTLTLDKFHGN